MTDTLWCDISEFQAVANNTYPHRWLAFRGNDGTYQDAHFTKNLAWSKKAIASGRLDAFIVYVVYRPDGGAWVNTLMRIVGTPHPRMVVMIDVENWDGAITGDHSADINAGVAKLTKWLDTSKRVLGYGNASDLSTIWPHRALATADHIVLANYSRNPALPRHAVHQYSDSGKVAPFGHPVDMNSADGYTSAALMKFLGIGQVTPVPKPTPKPAPKPVVPTPLEDDVKTIAQRFNDNQKIDGTERYLLWGSKGYVTLVTGPCEVVSGAVYARVETTKGAGPDARYQVISTVDTVSADGSKVLTSASLGTDEFAPSSGESMHLSPVPPVTLAANQRLRVQVYATDGLEGVVTMSTFHGSVA